MVCYAMRCDAHCDALRVRAAVGSWGGCYTEGWIFSDQGETAEDGQAARVCVGRRVGAGAGLV
jgi:hypothetical protein